MKACVGGVGAREVQPFSWFLGALIIGLSNPNPASRAGVRVIGHGGLQRSLLQWTSKQEIPVTKANGLPGKRKYQHHVEMISIWRVTPLSV